jgi:hypothetical protein
MKYALKILDAQRDLRFSKNKNEKITIFGDKTAYVIYLISAIQ